MSDGRKFVIGVGGEVARPVPPEGTTGSPPTERTCVVLPHESPFGQAVLDAHHPDPADPASPVIEHTDRDRLAGWVSEHWFHDESWPDAENGVAPTTIDPTGRSAVAYRVVVTRHVDDRTTHQSHPVLFSHVDDAVRWARSQASRVQVLYSAGTWGDAEFYDASDSPAFNGPDGQPLPTWPPPGAPSRQPDDGIERPPGS